MITVGRVCSTFSRKCIIDILFEMETSANGRYPICDFQGGGGMKNGEDMITNKSALLRCVCLRGEICLSYNFWISITKKKIFNGGYEDLWGGDSHPLTRHYYPWIRDRYLWAHDPGLWTCSIIPKSTIVIPKFAIVIHKMTILTPKHVMQSPDSRS